MITKEYGLEVVTPMFLAGADQQQAEIRAASIKGQLRWWWRALHGNLSLEELKKMEESIFGSTSKNSSFSIIVKNVTLQTSINKLPSGKKISVTAKGKTFNISVIDYLAYGIAEYQKGRGIVYTRPYIKPKSKFTLQIIYYDKSIIDSVEKAFYYWIVYGGLGAKNRNGFGALRFITNLNAPIIDINNKNLGNYTSFSSKTKLFVFGKHSSWENALSEIGKFYRAARLNLEPKYHFDRRKFVARPIIVKNVINISDRHAKPMYLHVDKMDGQFQGKILVLPYLYKETHNRSDFDSVIQDMSNFFIKSGGRLVNI